MILVRSSALQQVRALWYSSQVHKYYYKIQNNINYTGICTWLNTLGYNLEVNSSTLKRQWRTSAMAAVVYVCHMRGKRLIVNVYLNLS